MDEKELQAFCRDWLAAWTGNNPDALLEFYHKNASYSDPAHRKGLKGHEEIRRYFVKLLDFYRDWEWEPIEIFPIRTGAIVKWKNSIPTGTEVVHEIGLDIVEIEGGKIVRNEVYFDRSRLLAAVDKRRRDQRLIDL